MRALAFSFLMVALLPFSAHSLQVHSIQTHKAASANPVGNFGFSLEAGSNADQKASGCVHLTYAGVTSEFPNIGGGVVSAIRFYYAAGDGAAVTQGSQFFTSNLSSDAQGNMSISPVEFCGLTAGHYSFKYGLADANGAVLEFMADGDFNAAENSVDVN